MEFTLLFTKNLKQAVIRQFKSDENSTNKIIEIEESKTYPVQGFLYSEDFKNDDFMMSLTHEIKFYPIRAQSEFNLTLESFESLNYEDGKKIFDKMRENWILQNNISLVEEIFKVRNHLLGLFPNDRSGFFEELWFILKNNLGATNVKLIYNDIIKAKSEHEKNKLVKVKVQGERYPELTSCDEMDDMILKNYEKDFGNIFEITDYNKEKGQIVICGSIKKSPVMIMANIYQLTRLQKSLIASVFEGLNQ